MLFEEALDVLTDVKGSSSAVLAQATQVLQGTGDELAISALARIALDAQSEPSRREAAFVLLRTRLLAWQPDSTQVKDAVEEGLIKCLWNHISDDRCLAWRICSAISGVFCSSTQASALWSNLSSNVVKFLEEACQRPERLYMALELIKALYSDGLPDFLIIPNATLSSLLSMGLMHQDPVIQKSAYHSISALLESFSLRPEMDLPSECQTLFNRLIELCLTKYRQFQTGRYDLADEILDLMTSVESAVDFRGAVRLRRSRVWSMDSMNTLRHLLDLSHAQRWRDKDVDRRQDESRITQHVCHIATSACLTDIDTTIVNTIWEYLLDHLAFEYPSGSDDVEIIAKGWEVQRDDEETANDFELWDGTSDCSIIAWEQLERLIKATPGDVKGKFIIPYASRCFQLAKENLRSNYGKLYSAWMLWAIYLGVKKQEDNPDIECSALIFQHWKDSVELVVTDTIFDAYQTARIRWAALLFMNEAVESFGSSLVSSNAQMISLIQQLVKMTHVELVPRVKAKCYLTFCQLLGNLMDSDLSQEESFTDLLRLSFQESLLPRLSSSLMLDYCRSLTFKAFDLTCEQVIAMEVFLKELIICSVSSCMPHLGSALPEFYSPIFTFCRNLLDSVTKNPEIGYVAEAALELASRSVECVGVFCVAAAEAGDARNDSIVIVHLECVAENSIYLLDKIIELDKFVQETRNSIRPSCIKSGIAAQSFERTLLQSAARAFSVAPMSKVAFQARYLLSMVVKKLTVTDMVHISDQVDQSETVDNALTSVIVSEPRGGQKRININTILLEEQIESLSFLGVTSSRICEILTDTETDEVIKLIIDCLKTSPFALVRKAGVEALKEICDTLATKFKQMAEVLPSIVDQGMRPSPIPFLSNSEFFGAFKNYLHRMRQSLQAGCDVVAKANDPSEDESTFYAIADMVEGARDAALYFGCSLTSLDPTMQSALEVDSFQSFLDVVFERLYTSLSTLHNTAESASVKKVLGDDDEDESEETDYFGLRCDAAMQLVSRLAKAFGPWVSTPFDKYLKSFFASILAAEDVSVIARTAALCVFANYLEATRGQDNVAADDLLPVALLYCRPQPMDPATIRVLRQHIPQFADGRPPYSVEEDSLPGLASVLRLQTGSTSREVVSEFLEPYRPEFMKLQAACYCVGAACLYASKDESVVTHLPRIDETFAGLVEHPLATLTSRRVIIDCLCCATLKIFCRLHPTTVSAGNGLKIFSQRGLFTLLQTCFPLTDDNEDAAEAHDILINWVLDGPTGALIPLFGSENDVEPGDEKQFRALLCNILRDLTQAEPSLLSLSARVGGRLERALSVLSSQQ